MRELRTHRSDAGMTLPEVMTASAILLVCLTALATLLGAAISSSQTAKMRDEAANLANARIEAARTIPYDSVGVRYANGLLGDPAGEILTPETVGRYTVETLVSWVRDAEGRAAYKKFTVRVSWAQPLPGKVEVTTMIYGRSNITGTGDMLVKLRYRETGLPVTNTSVSEVDANGVARGVMSDSKGEAFFAKLPVGQANLTVTPPAGYILDTTSLADSVIAADSLTSLIVYVQQPATTLIKVRNGPGSPVVPSTVVVRRDDGVTATYTVNANGEVMLQNLLYGDYSVTCSAPGYTSATVPLSVTQANPGATLRVTLALTSYANLVVSVIDGNGTKLSNAVVHVKGSSGGVDLDMKTTSSNGEAAFYSLVSGSYLIVVERSGYDTAYKSIGLGDSGSTVVVSLVSSAKGNLHITTLDKNGHAGAIRVIINGPGYYRDDLSSSTAGSLTLSSLPTGSYQVSCYDSPASVATVIISAAQTADVTVAQAKK